MAGPSRVISWASRPIGWTALCLAGERGGLWMGVVVLAGQMGVLINYSSGVGYAQGPCARVARWCC
ncbi:hypothetical protein EMIT048CA2_40062 [Pseudomonas chlororaphis]